MSKIRTIFISIFSLIILPFLTYSQETEELLKHYFNEVRDGKYPAIPKQLSITENSKTTLIALTPYLNDTASNIRSKAYSLAQVAGSNTRNSAIRESVVRILMEGYKDPDSGNAGQALDYLTTFRNEDFNSFVKDTIRNVFKGKPAHFDKLIRLAGFLELMDLTEDIRPFTLAGNPQQLRWAAIVSLTRMNDPVAQQDMMKRIKKLPVNDEVIYTIYPDLIYSRNREVINYIIQVMQRDEKLCMSADAEREIPILCGYRIMEQLAPAIKDYPVKLDESGDIKAKDYLAALASVRHWFTKHPDFEILKDRY